MEWRDIVPVPECVVINLVSQIGDVLLLIVRNCE